MVLDCRSGALRGPLARLLPALRGFAGRAAATVLRAPDGRRLAMLPLVPDGAVMERPQSVIILIRSIAQSLSRMYWLLDEREM
ncbi:MAG TPA: hypothetical protein VNQ99_06980 [Xanthobacteraceae bacterium]|nr:hypothetical protein [Xanthobacteraceae bacterium]